jgi:hypothetical protein
MHISKSEVFSGSMIGLQAGVFIFLDPQESENRFTGNISRITIVYNFVHSRTRKALYVITKNRKQSFFCR